MSNSKSYKRDVTARMRGLGFHHVVASGGHLWFTHENQNVEQVSAASSPGDADEQIRIVLGKAKRAMRAANLDVDEYQDRAKLRAFHELPAIEESDVVSLLLEADMMWETIGEIAYQLDTDLNSTATTVTRLENRGVVVRMIDDDGQPARFAAASRVAPTKEQTMTTIEVPAEVLAVGVGRAEKLADGWRAIMRVLEQAGGWLPSSEAKRLAAADSSASEDQLAKIAKPGGVVFWREQKRQGRTFWALPGVEVPGANPLSLPGHTTAAPAPQPVAAGATPPPTPLEAREDLVADERADLADALLAAVDAYIEGMLNRVVAENLELRTERDQLAAKLEQIEDVLTAASSGIKIS